MKTAEEILKDKLRYCGTKMPIVFRSHIIKAMKAYAEQAIERCAEEGSTKGIDWRIDIMEIILKVKSELK